MATTVYLLCTLTSGLCAVLLLREHRRTPLRLLLWSGLAFVGLAISNILVFVDLIVLPSIDFSIYRGAIFMIAIALLLYGLVREAD